MRKQMEGQLSIFDIHLAGQDRKPCEYTFQRYIGQRVRSKSKYGVQYTGTIVSMEPYYTHIRTDDGREIVGTPYDVDPEENICESCKHFFRYTAGIGEWIHGTACGINSPSSVDVDPAMPACNRWERKT